MADLSLINISVEITRIFAPIIVIFGAMGNTINIIILSRLAFSQHACSLYFLVLSINNLFYSTVLLVINLLNDGYHINMIQYSVAACKSIGYLLNLCPNISIYLIVLASIDRFCVSSSNIKLRAFGDIRIARIMTIVVILTLAVFYIGVLVIFDLAPNNKIVCAPTLDTVTKQSFIIAEVVVFAVVAPCLLIIFGLLTIFNVTQLNVIPVVVVGRRTERQLIRMLLLQLVVHLILTLPFSAMYLVLVLPIAFRTSVLFASLFTIFKLPFYLSFITPFFLYILSARIYRAQFMQIMAAILHYQNNNRVHALTT